MRSDEMGGNIRTMVGVRGIIARHPSRGKPPSRTRYTSARFLNADAPPPSDENAAQQRASPASAATSADQPPRQAAPPVAADETVKETIESIVIAFILAFVFRAFIVEPFIIPTGSMAPTMLGSHLQLDCPSCGYGFDVGTDVSIVEERGLLKDAQAADCPMCNRQVIADVGTSIRAGDRILVDKFSYHLKQPSRWDVVVFKAPKGQPIGGEPAPRTNFIKRLVGLPGERVALLDGNIYVAPAGTEDFVIARKTDPQANLHWEKVQRSVWQPVYHSQYVPIQNGQADGPGRDARHRWRVPWQAIEGDWELGTARRASRVYRFAGGEGAIEFEMRGEAGTLRYDNHDAAFPYNQLSSAIRLMRPIEDIRLACAVTPGPSEMQITLSTTARLDRPDLGVERLEARITSSGDISLHATMPANQSRQLGETVRIGKQLPAGVASSIELWLVDDQASVWVDGERVLVYNFDLTWQQIAERPEQADTPEVRICIRSESPVELRRVELDRDLYYYPDRFPSTPYARAEARRVDGSLQLGRSPLDLRRGSSAHDAEFFVLGDNQPASEDGRSWSDVDGWVQQRYFGGEERAGVVPESLLVGRAFMVYYPAPHGLSPYDNGIIPDFGRMRFVH